MAARGRPAIAISFRRNARSVCSGDQPSSLALFFTRSSTTLMNGWEYRCSAAGLPPLTPLRPT
jgi:hypothetical protein